MAEKVSHIKTQSDSEESNKIVIWCLKYYEDLFNSFVSMYCDAVEPDMEFEVVGIDTVDEMRQQFSFLYYTDNYNELPDIIIPNDYNEYLTEYPELFLPLNDYIDTDAFVTESVYKNLVNNESELLMGYPFSSSVVAFYYNKSVFDECGLDVTENYTLDDFLTYAKAIRERYGGEKYIIANTTDLARIFMQSTGKLFYDEDGNIVYDNVMELFEFLEHLYNYGYINIDTIQGVYEHIGLLANEKICGVIGTPSWIKRIGAIVADYGLMQEWDIAHLPRSYPFEYNVSLGESACLLVNKNDEEKQAIMADFLTWTFTANEEAASIMAEYGAIVPVTKFVCNQLKNLEYPQCFIKNVYSYLADMLTDIPVIEYGDETERLLDRLDKVTQKVLSGKMNALTAYNTFVNSDIPVEDEPRSLVRIEIATPPNKKEYYIYEQFERKGMVVVGVYSDGTKAQITSYRIEPAVFEIAGQQEVKICYWNGAIDLYAYQNVTVDYRELVSISIVNTNRIFLQGDTLSNNDFSVTANYDNDSHRNVRNFEIVNKSLDNAGKQEVRIRYTEGVVVVSNTTVVNVTRRLKEIFIEQMPKKLMYYANSRFDTTGMKVVASYFNDTEEIVPNGRLMISPDIIKFKSGTNKAIITVTYVENGVEATVALPVYKKTGVELDDCNITQDFGVSGSGAVNTSSGELYYGFKDFICAVSDFPIAIARTYKTDAGNCGVGTGWRLNLQQELIEDDGQLKYIDKNGKEHIFESGYLPLFGRSWIRNEELGLDLFKTADGIVSLVDRSNNTLVFTKVAGVYRLSAVHKYPSTPDNPIDPYCMQIKYDTFTGLITNVAAGRKIDGKRRNVNFVYNGGLLTQLQYNFASTTVVAEYEYDGSVLTAIKKCNGNVNSPYTATTQFQITDSSFTVVDKSSKDGDGNYKSLIYTIGVDRRVSAVSVGYGEDDRETTSINYTGRIEPTEDDNHITDIVASCYTEYNDILSVTSFNSQCSAATYSYEKGEDGTYAKPKKVYSASSRGFDYKALADSYSNTLDVEHDDFADNSYCDWTGGTLNTGKCICGTASLYGNQLSKKYKVTTNAKEGVTMFLSLWVFSTGYTKVTVNVSSSLGSDELSHNLDSRLTGKWQFTACNLGRMLKGDTITVTISGIGNYIDDIRLTKAPYETPDDIAEPKYNNFGNIEKQYVYSPIDKKVACSTYKYNDEHQITEKAVTVDGKAHSKSVYSYTDGLLVSDKEYGKGNGYFEETYTYADYVQTKMRDANDVLTEYSEGIDWVQSVIGPSSYNSESVTVKNTYYTNSNFVKQVVSENYVNNLTYNASGDLLSAQYGSAQSSDNRSEITFEYDTFGNMKKAIIGTVALVTCEYDYKHLNKITYANGGSTEYTYDGKNRITAITESGGYSATVIYGDDAEDTVTITDNNGVQYQSKTVNTGGKTTEYSASFEGDSPTLKVVGLAMNGAGNISTTEIYTDDGETPFERLKTVVDRNGQLTQLSREYHGPSSTYAYDELYRLKNKNTTLSSTTFKNEYKYYGDNDERKFPRLFLEQLTVGKTDDVFSYLYHHNGFIADVLWNGKPHKGYAYDEYGRLIWEINFFFDEKYVYKYDVNGNILSKTTYPIDGSTPLATQVYDYTTVTDGCGQNAAWRDQLKSYNGQAIHYDGYGNPTVYLGKHLTWNARKLVKIDNTEMEYDYNGMRVKKGSKRYYWHGNNLRMEKDSVTNSKIYYYYDESGVCGMNLNGTDYYYRKNMLGDICAVYNSVGELVCRYVYDAWGNHRLYDKNGNQINDDGTTVGSKNPFRYRGYYWDREFGLYYLQSRYYDPALGRFISPDSIDYLAPSSINGMNLYAYCGNNPIMYIDPTGCAEWWEWLLGGVVVVGVTGLTLGAAYLLASAFGLSSATVSGAAIGSFTTGSFSLIAQGTTGNKEINYGRLAFDTFWGGATGAFSGAVSGAYSTGPFTEYYFKQIFLNIGIYSGSYLLSCAITGDKPTIVGLFMAAAGGAVNGMVAGWYVTSSIIASLFGVAASYWEAVLEWILDLMQEE